MIVTEAGYVVGMKPDKRIQYACYDGGDVFPADFHGRASFAASPVNAHRYASLADIRRDLGDQVFAQCGSFSGAYFADRAIGKDRAQGKSFHPDIQGISLADIVIRRVDLAFEPITISASDVDHARYHYITRPGNSVYSRIGKAGLTAAFGDRNTLKERITPAPQGYDDGGYLLLDRTYFENHDKPEFAATGEPGQFWGLEHPCSFKHDAYARFPIGIERPCSDDVWGPSYNGGDTSPNLWGLISTLYLSREVTPQLAECTIPARLGIKAVPMSAAMLEYIRDLENSRRNWEWGAMNVEATVRGLHRLSREQAAKPSLLKVVIG